MSHSPSPTGSPAGWAVVTGATSGIGLEFARQLAARGHDLVLVARDAARLEATAKELAADHGIATEVITADLATREGMALVEQRLADTARPVELLVNNAGFGLKERFLVNSVEDEQAMLDVLVTAVMRLTHAALGPMTARGRGGVINVSSVAGYLPRGTYGAAKSWVNTFSQWAHNEYAGSGVRVMALCPGFTKTEFHERLGAKKGDSFLWMEADQLVRTALADFDKGRAFSIPGVQYKAVVALARAVPSSILQRFQSLGRK